LFGSFVVGRAAMNSIALNDSVLPEKSKGLIALQLKLLRFTYGIGTRDRFHRSFNPFIYSVC
jgi:hypothetical protein